MEVLCWELVRKSEVVRMLFFIVFAPNFASLSTAGAILRVTALVTIMAVGMTFVIVCAEIDLSVGSIAGLGAISTGKLMAGAGLSVPLAVLGGLLLGALIGLLNGLVVVRLKIPAFIQTLGMLFIGQGLIQVITNGYPVYPLPDAVADFYLRLGPRLVVLKMGAQGAMLATGDSRIRLAPHPCSPIDATGAGDTFCGSFLARIIAGDPPEAALRYAGCAAALSTMGFGAVDPIPRSEAVRAALAFV